MKDILPKSAIDFNLHEAEMIDWLKVESVLIYDRSSPDRPGRKRLSSHWKIPHMVGFASQRNIKVSATVVETEQTGYRIGPKLKELLEQAKQTGCPILAFDWRRFGRSEKVLAKIATYGVKLICITPLDATERDLNKGSKRQSQSLNPGGRPAYKSMKALLFILDNLPNSWRAIARKMNSAEIPTQKGGKWDHKQAKLLLSRFFAYRSEL